MTENLEDNSVTICQLCRRVVSWIATYTSFNDVSATNALQRTLYFADLHVSGLSYPKVKHHHCLHHVQQV